MGSMIPFPQDAVFLKDGHPVTTSLKVSEIFGKQHKNVLQAVKNLGCSEEFGRRNFQPSSYLNEQNKQQPMYEITRQGFTILVMGFTGPQAMQFKEAYIAQFDAMEATLTAGAGIDTTLLAEMIRQAVAAALPQPVTEGPRKMVMVDAADWELMRIKTEQPESRGRINFSEEEKITMRVLREQKWSYGTIGKKIGRSENSVSDFFRRERVKQQGGIA